MQRCTSCWHRVAGCLLSLSLFTIRETSPATRRVARGSAPVASKTTMRCTRHPLASCAFSHARRRLKHASLRQVGCAGTSTSMRTKYCPSLHAQRSHLLQRARTTSHPFRSPTLLSPTSRSTQRIQRVHYNVCFYPYSRRLPPSPSPM